MRSAFQEIIANEILHKLETNPCTVAELAADLHRNYYTTRLVVQSLMADGIIIRADNKFRNGKLALVAADTPTSVIPSVSIGTVYYKLTQVLSMRHQKRSNGADAVLRFPMHITRLLNAAVSLSEGKDQTRTLKLLQREMEKDREYIQQAVDIYDQILKNPVNWNPDSLKRFITDPALDMRDLKDAYSYYFDTQEASNE
jgi:predicted transcriptional regulator